MTDFLAELAALAEKATPGPWEEEYDPIDDGDHPTAICLPGRAGLPGTFIAYFQHNWNDAYAGERRISWKEAETNAALIVLLRNNLPAILALGRERDALREAFDKPNDDLTFILGQPCFAFISHAQVWRAAGHEIKTRAEDEQAFFIGRMLHHYFADQGNWRSRWNEEMDAVLKAAEQALEGGNQ